MEKDTKEHTPSSIQRADQAYLAKLQEFRDAGVLYGTVVSLLVVVVVLCLTITKVSYCCFPISVS
jgi:tetrahydromethanopterin S-methyltransferase subunit G